jgi:hypothetical protein
MRGTFMELLKHSSNEDRVKISDYRGCSSGVTTRLSFVLEPPGRDWKISRTVDSNATRASAALTQKGI